MSYSSELIDLIKHARAKGLSPLAIKSNAAIISYLDGDKDELSAAVDYYVAEHEDSKELALIRLDSATEQLMKLLHADNKGVQLSAARVLVNVIDRYAKLLGLDSPVKIDSTQRTITYQIDGVDTTRILE